MRRRLLAVAYHYPPIQDSSGVHRMLAFSRHLAEMGWDTTVLTAHRRAYDSILPANEAMIPVHVEVVRAQAWDTCRHFALGGRYLRAMALPDRWQSWIVPGVLAGLGIIRRQRPAALFSTFPIASAHLIALALKRLSGLPWVADFRDPMHYAHYPEDPVVRRVYGWLERQVFRHADRILVTTPGTAAYYRERHGERAAKKLRVIANGFDPEILPPGFLDPRPAPAPAGGRRLGLLHSGVLYPRERNPEPFFRALAALQARGDLAPGDLEVVFRASGFEDVHGATAQALGLGDVVRFQPSLPYREALQEMLAADALLVFQAANCNRQIPAKLYEYFCARRPILGFTDPAGDTGQLLRRMGVDTLAPLDDAAAITDLLRATLPRLRAGELFVPSHETVMSLSRRARAAELALELDAISTPPDTAGAKAREAVLPSE